MSSEVSKFLFTCFSQDPKERATGFKNKGNNLFKVRKYKEAIECYSEAIKVRGLSANPRSDRRIFNWNPVTTLRQVMGASFKSPLRRPSRVDAGLLRSCSF